ncbi:hypothetical protein QBC43DRAFT_366687 [Cladorrhinum sp. PSN259]|nr:hypothetical protein QBC43DRAFT_366687 [Cladorrhinum sp. PSN259]
MADPIGVTASIIGIVSFGLKLGTTLQAWLETASEADDWIRDIIFDVNTTTSVLRQLQEIIDDDKLAAKQQNRPTLLKPEGLERIQLLADQCEKSYKAIIVLVYKASSQESKEPPSLETPNSNLIKSLTLLRRLRWPLREPRARRCREDLRWLKVSLLLQLQIVNISHLHFNQKSDGTQSGGDLEEEALLRMTAEKLKHRQLVIAKQNAKQKEAKKSQHRSPTPEVPASPPRSAPPVLTVRPLSSARQKFAAPLATPSPPAGGPTAALHVLPKHIDTAMTSSPLLECSSLEADAPRGSAIVGGPGKRDSESEIGTANIAGAEVPGTGFIPMLQTGTVASPVPEGLEAAQVECFSESPKPGTKDENTQNIQLLSPDPGPIPERGLRNAPPTPPQSSTSLVQSSVAALSRNSSKSKLLSFNVRNYFRKSTTTSPLPFTDLEAWIIASNDLDSVPEKLHLSRQQLQKSLRLLERKAPSLPIMTPTQRFLIDKVVEVARKDSSHQRTRLTVQERKEPGQPGAYIVYFSLGELQLPIYFKDAHGRKYDLPYETVIIWEDMRAKICEMYKGTTLPKIDEQEIVDGKYDLKLEGGGVILPTLWAITVKPGAKVSMHMWPEESERFVYEKPRLIEYSRGIEGGLSANRPTPHSAMTTQRRVNMPPSSYYSPPSPPPMPPSRRPQPAQPTGSYMPSDYRRPTFSPTDEFGWTEPGRRTPPPLEPLRERRTPAPRERRRGVANDIGLESNDTAKSKQRARSRSRSIRAAHDFDSFMHNQTEAEEDEEEEEEEFGVIDFSEVLKDAEEEGQDAVAGMLKRFTNIAEEKIEAATAPADSIMTAERGNESRPTTTRMPVSDTRRYSYSSR